MYTVARARRFGGLQGLGTNKRNLLWVTTFRNVILPQEASYTGHPEQGDNACAYIQLASFVAGLVVLQARSLARRGALIIHRDILRR